MRSKPKKLLVPIERMPLSQFYELVGEEMFGNDWKRIPAQPTDVSVGVQSQSPVPSDEPELKEDLVKAQILRALRSGKLTAEFHFKKTTLMNKIVIDVQKWVHDEKRKLYKAGQRKSRQLGVGSGSNSPLEEEEEEEIEAKPPGYCLPAEIEYEPGRRFKAIEHTDPIYPAIDKGFWELDEASSEIPGMPSTTVPIQHLKLDRQGGNPFEKVVPLDGVPLGIQHESGRIWIREPGRAIDGAIDWPNSRQVEGWGSVYVRYRQIFWPELIAMIWRLIAIKDYKPYHGVIDKIFKDLEDHLAQREGAKALPRHLQVSDTVLKEIISKVVKQLEKGEGALLEPVLVKQRK